MSIIAEVMSLLILIGFSISLGYVASPEIDSIMNKLQNNYGDSPEECMNFSLENTAYCLNDYVRSIYRYEETEDKINLNLTELIERGGDCKNWAELYSDYATDLGFETNNPIISTGNNTAHMFTIVSDKTGYCLLDQRRVKCFGLANDDE